MEIKVVAQQYSFDVHLPGRQAPAAADANTLVVPVNVPIHLSIQSKDVIHDWWVEDLAQKTDVIPGRTTHTWFRAEQDRKLRGTVREFCGPGHATMLITSRWSARRTSKAYMADKAQ